MRIQIFPVIFLSCLAAAQAQANCAPPFMTMFSCDIMGRDARVEFCADNSSDNADDWRYSYNFTSGLGPSELYFEVQSYYGSTKYMPEGDIPYDTLGSGLLNGDYVYAFFATGYGTRNIQSAQIHVYRNLDDFQSRPESDIERLYCQPETVRIDWDGTGPG